jgi:hypothetical protein
MGRIFFQIVLPIFFVLEFHNESMSNPALSELELSVNRTRLQGGCKELNRDEQKLTAIPSGLFSLPPTAIFRYGVLVVGWRHLSLSASMRLHT